MSSYKGSDKREVRRTRKNAEKYPELTAGQSDLDAHLEREMNKLRFGPLQARNRKQQQMIDLIDQKRIVFVTGPAGVGKTMVSTSLAAEALEKGDIQRIVIVRPMIGCGDDMGFLPGDIMEKYLPWLGPFLDVLEGKLGKKKVESYLKFEIISAMPLLMMRGATFRNAMVILDEAQNTTPAQMKMFLTRIGEGSKVVIDGDLEQSDLPFGKDNGLADALGRLKHSNSAGFVEFTEDEITRDPLVREIVLAYRN